MDIKENEDKKEINFSLRNYQEEANDNINNIFYGDSEYNKYAAVVLPTGGGKSYIAMQQILSACQNKYQEKERNGQINDAKILYIAPSTAIHSQIKLHIIREIIFSISDLDKMNIEDINKLIKSDYPQLKFKGISTSEILDNGSASEKKNAIIRSLNLKQIDGLVKNAFPNLEFKCYDGINGAKGEKDLVIVDEAHRVNEPGKSWFEGLKSFIGQQSSNTKFLAITATPERGDKSDPLGRLASLIYKENTVMPDNYIASTTYVLDAMRDGIVNAPEVVECNSFLADSAEYLSVLNNWKNASENSKEKEFFSEILDEMEKIIGFSPRKLEEYEGWKKSKDATKIDDFEEKLGISLKNEKGEYLKASEVKEEIRTKNIQKVISENVNPNGKYVAFIPPNRKEDDSKKYYLNKAREIREHFKNVRDEKGQPIKVTISFVSSKANGECVFSEDGTIEVKNKKSGEEVLKDFEGVSNTSGGIKIVLSVKKLDEGIHVEGIDGAIMYDKIPESEIKYLQRSGRCISSLNPNKPLESQTKTKLIDIVGNTMVQVNRGTGEKTSRSYDLKKFHEISEWIKKRGSIPGINKFSENGSDKEKANCEAEARLAIAMKKLIEKYYIYKDGLRPSEDADKVDKIMDIVSNITEKLNTDFWKIEIPERDEKPSEEELTGGNFLRYSENQKKFMDLYNEAIKEKAQVLLPEDRVKKLIRTLQILKLHEEKNKQIIPFPNGITITSGKNGENTIKTKDEKISLKAYLNANFEQEEINKIILELKNNDLYSKGNTNKQLVYPDEIEQYDFAEEMAFVRGKFWTSQYEYHSEGKSSFENYSLKELFDVHLVQDVQNDLKELSDCIWNFYVNVKKQKNFSLNDFPGIMDNGFIKKGSRSERFNIGLIEEFEECMMTGDNRGEKFINGYDRDGYDGDGENGYDKRGYNKFGFNKDGIHKITLKNYDDRGFSYNKELGKWINNITNDEYDALGYNIYGVDKRGFERPHKRRNGSSSKPKWHKSKEENGRIIGYDVHGYEKDENGQDVYGISNMKKTNNRGFYYNGATKKQQQSKPIGSDDYYKDGFDALEYDRNGFKTVKLPDGKTLFINRETSQTYNKKGEEFDGKNLKENENISIFREVMKKIYDKDTKFSDINDLKKIIDMLIKDGTFKGITQEEIMTSLDEAIEISRIATEAFSKIELEIIMKDRNDIEHKLIAFTNIFPEYRFLLIAKSEAILVENERKQREIQGCRSIKKPTKEDEEKVEGAKRYKILLDHGDRE